MISWLIEQSLLLTLFLALLILFQDKAVKRIGAISFYRLWAIVPILLFASVVASYYQPQVPQQVSQYLVLAKETSETLASVNMVSGGYLTIVWTSGALMLAGYFLFGHWRFIKQLQLNPATVEQLPSRKLAVFSSEQTSTPFVIGVLKPMLVIPTDFEQNYSKQQQQLILQHELCHLQRGDLIWNLLAICLLVMFWFHPLAWLALNRFRQVQELACDQQVLTGSSKAQRVAYGNAMLINPQQTSTLYPYPVHFGDKETMFKRIENLKNIKVASRFKVVLLALSLLTAGSGLQFAMAYDAGNKAKKDDVKPLIRIEPKYPIEAAKNKVEGYVVLSYTIEADGSTSRISVTDSYPSNVFDKESIKALAQWQYSKSSSSHHGVFVRLDFQMDPKSTVKKPKSNMEAIRVGS